MQKAFVCFLGVCVVLAACNTPTVESVNSDQQNDKLAEVLARGALIIATDADYEPQSKLLRGVISNPNTKCSPAQYTANQMTGFDVDVAVEIAHRLGVEPCFVTPPWSQLVAGNWGDNWDIHVGSVAITLDRMQVLYFSQPYYATPTVVLINKQNTTFKKAEDLSGKRIGICVGCTFESYLKGTLQVPGEKIEYRIQNAQITGYENEAPAIEDLSAGDGVKLDAVITIYPVAKQAIDVGKPVKVLDKPLWFTFASVTMDRASRHDPIRLLNEVSTIIRNLHADGTLMRLSVKYQGLDFTQEAARFDIASLNQFSLP